MDGSVFGIPAGHLFRKEAEDSELETRKTALFQEKYAELVKKVTGFHVYTEAIAAAISYKGQTTIEETTEAATTTNVEEETTAASN